MSNSRSHGVQGMTKSLVSKAILQKPLILWNRTYKVAIDHSTLIGHSEVVQSVEEAVPRSDIIWSCLSNHRAVFETYHRALKGDVRGKLFVESSTLTPEATNEISRIITDAGAQFVAMPGAHALE